MEIYGLLATGGIYDLPVISQISWLLGQVMNGIYHVMSAIGVDSIGVSIIIFTFIVYMVLLPLTIKQQKFTKMNSVMSPEIQKIQKKYSGKKDQASMLKQQEEMNAVYDKYGVKMSSGCLPSLFQLLILFGLYPVVWNVPRYVTQVREAYMPLIEKIQSVSGYEKIIEEVAGKSITGFGSYDLSNTTSLAEIFYKFQNSTWEALTDKIPGINGLVDSTVAEVGRMNNFLGIDIGAQPWEVLKDAIAVVSVGGIILAILIPVLAGLTQFISVKLSQATTSGNALSDSDNPMMKSMQTMTYTMPLISVFFGFSLPAGLGLYWIASAVVRSIQQLLVNRHLNKLSVEDIIAQNQEKAKKKREKKGTSAEEINRMATKSTKNMGLTDKSSNRGAIDAEKEEKIRKAQETAKNAKPGSLTAKANMVSRYNSGHVTLDPVPEEEKAEKTKGKRKK